MVSLITLTSGQTWVRELQRSMIALRDVSRFVIHVLRNMLLDR
jgi:hypothetical protein